MSTQIATYRPRNPQSTVLYKAISENWQPFLDDVAERDRHLPEYVKEEFLSYLDCRNLEAGFARLKCNDCRFERLLPFSCKRRGFCPSCCGRRMNESELSIVDEVFPFKNARQWVLSLPIPVRFFSSRNRPLLNGLVKVFYGTLNKLIRKKLRAKGVKNALPGGIIFIQRLGGALNLNVHFHAIFLDGGFLQESEDQPPVFHELEDDLISQDIEWAVTKIARRSYKIMQKLGLLDDDLVAQTQDELEGIELCDGASIKNMIAFGERAGKPVRKLKIVVDQNAKAQSHGNLVAELNGFNLKADKFVKGHQRWKLARLVRYVTRPPLSTERLTFADDGKTVRYTMKRPWSDGTTQVVLSGVELIEKLSAAVPPPRGHLVRYCGALAPNSQIRSQIVPKPKPKSRDETGKVKPSATATAAWAVLMKHSFGLDLKSCPLCGGEVKLIAIIFKRELIQAILKHISRAPPENKAKSA